MVLVLLSIAYCDEVIRILFLLTGFQMVRAKKIQAAYRKAEAGFARENEPKAEELRNLGLLGKEEDTRKVLSS